MTTQRMSSRLLHTDQFVMSDVFTLQSTTKRTTVMYQTKTLEGQLKRAAGSQQIHRVCCRLEFENDSTCAHQGRRQIRRSIFVYRLSVHVIPLYYYAHLFSSVRRARTGLGLNPQICSIATIEKPIAFWQHKGRPHSLSRQITALRRL